MRSDRIEVYEIKGLKKCIQLFRERLSEKVHATIPKGIVEGFEFTVLQRNLKELARKAMKMCLRVLTESNQSRFDSYNVRNSVLIISHITFRDCRVHISSDNLSGNSCMQNLFTSEVNSKDGILIEELIICEK